MEPIQYELNTIKQFAALTPDQFARMLPDFILWHDICGRAKKQGFGVIGFIWVDDGHSGKLHSIDISIEKASQPT